MSYNPARAKNFYKNANRRRKQDPHAGTKHSDILRRQGFGSAMPAGNRVATPRGMAATLFDGPNWTARIETIAAGNNLGYGVNPEADRLYSVLSGVLYVIVGEGEERTTRTVQAGGGFCAARGMHYAVGTSTGDVEVMIVEDADYAKTWEALGDVVESVPEAPAVSPGPMAAHVGRRKDQTVAKAQALKAAVKKGRRNPRKATPRKSGATSMSGAKNVGRNAATNVNSGNVEGVNPMPGGAGAYAD